MKLIFDYIVIQTDPEFSQISDQQWRSLCSQWNSSAAEAMRKLQQFITKQSVNYNLNINDI